MSIGGFSKDRAHAAPQSEINMVPLIDVMMVLLVIFIITAPLLTNSVRLELPKSVNQSDQVSVQNIRVSIDAQGIFYWDGQKLDKDQLTQKFSAAGKEAQQPQIRLYADKTTQYQLVTDVLAAATQAGLSKIAFVTTP